MSRCSARCRRFAALRRGTGEACAGRYGDHPRGGTIRQAMRVAAGGRTLTEREAKEVLARWRAGGGERVAAVDEW